MTPAEPSCVNAALGTTPSSDAIGRRCVGGHVTTVGSPFMPAIRGTFFRAVDPRFREFAFQGPRSASRYCRADDLTRYLGLPVEGVDASMLAHNGVLQRNVEIDVEASRIVCSRGLGASGARRARPAPTRAMSEDPHGEMFHVEHVVSRSTRVVSMPPFHVEHRTSPRGADREQVPVFHVEHRLQAQARWSRMACSASSA